MNSKLDYTIGGGAVHHNGQFSDDPKERAAEMAWLRDEARAAADAEKRKYAHLKNPVEKWNGTTPQSGVSALMAVILLFLVPLVWLNMP